MQALAPALNQWRARHLHPVALEQRRPTDRKPVPLAGSSVPYPSPIKKNGAPAHDRSSPPLENGLHNECGKDEADYSLAATGLFTTQSTPARAPCHLPPAKLGRAKHYLRYRCGV